MNTLSAMGGKFVREYVKIDLTNLMAGKYGLRIIDIE